ncbi:Domain of uncharacterised function (DUF2825) [Klebsiella pneumoniae]|nr:Domain of uncharacterised function (DUF2825) [Klebsiella pneumoniae]
MLKPNGSGLSPLARGTQKDIRSPALPNRFIPAGAGNTGRERRQAGSRAVYPRWRGEHLSAASSHTGSRGLSPLARGTCSVVRAGLLAIRFIPAGAGNTAPPCNLRYGISVYPRWRGEHPVRIASVARVFGLSPLARGTRGEENPLLTPDRFIPAGAGNTESQIDITDGAAVYPRWRGEHW